MKLTRPIEVLWLIVVVAIIAISCRPDVTALVINHINIVDVEKGTVVRDRTVLISRERIQAVSRSDAQSLPRNALVVDGTGKYLIPGLWDMHIHLNGPDSRDGFGNGVFSPFSDAEVSALVADGITGVRDMGGTLERIRQRQVSNIFPAPDTVAAGRLLDGPGNPPGDHLIVPNNNAACAAVNSALTEGSEFIKVHDWLTSDVYSAVANCARQRGVHVVGHIPVPVPARVVINAGQRSIEHLGNIYSGILLNVSTREDALRDALVGRHRESPGSQVDLAFSPTFVRAVVDSYDSVKADASGPTRRSRQAALNENANPQQFARDLRLTVEPFGGQRRVAGLT